MYITPADIGKKFRTRNNKVAAVIDIDTEYEIYPVVADHGDEVRHHTRDGHWYINKSDNPYDLVDRVDDVVEVVESGNVVLDMQDRVRQAGCKMDAEAGPQNVLRTLPADATERKGAPVTTGGLDYFPLAIAEVARISKAGNDQHNPGQPLRWARYKSADHADCIARHLIERGAIDTDGQRHSAKMAWRALALLQEELERAAGWAPAKEAHK